MDNINELTVEVLEHYLQHFAVLGLNQNARQIAEHYFSNTDHGFIHSVAVWKRCQAIMDQSPLLCRLIPRYASKILMIVSIFHDMGRFLEAKFEEHEKVGADLVRRMVIGNCRSDLVYGVYNAIICHDYFCPIVNGYEIPYEAIQPLSEIFRLADKTSISPSAEVRRYHQTGRRLDPTMPLFDQSIPDEVRFSFGGEHNRDQLTWMLAIFALQSTDFVYGETREAYAYWARGKYQALKEIGQLCLEEEYLEGRTPVEPEEAMQVVRRFCHKFNLIYSTSF